jgi:hypothetical protein
LATHDKGLIFRPTTNGLHCYVDADFSGNWDRDDALLDPDTASSCTGFIAMYAGCPIFWTSKLQTTISLLSTEAEYIVLSTALREVIPVMELLKERNKRGIDCGSQQPTLHCKVFEDNSGALEIATKHQWRPRTKHINVQYHHFCSFVNDGSIKILPISSEEQPADILTKPVSSDLLIQHRSFLMGW